MMFSEMVSKSPGSIQPDSVEFRFPLWCRVAAPIAVGAVSSMVLGFAVWASGLDLVAWLAIAVVIILVGLEVHKRSMAIVVTSADLVERDLLGQRILSLAHLERARLFRNARLWFHFTGESKPVWVLKGMGDPRAIMDLVVSRAQAHGLKPEVVCSNKA